MLRDERQLVVKVPLSGHPRMMKDGLKIELIDSPGFDGAQSAELVQQMLESSEVPCFALLLVDLGCQNARTETNMRFLELFSRDL